MRAIIVGLVFLLLSGCTKVIVKNLDITTSKGAIIRVEYVEYRNLEELNLVFSGYGISGEVEGGE